MFCRDPLGRQPRATCTECQVAVHAECAAELRRCPTIGCVEAWPPPVVAVPPTDAVTGGPIGPTALVVPGLGPRASASAAPDTPGPEKPAPPEPEAPAPSRRPRARWRVAAALALAAPGLTWAAHARPRPGVEHVLGGWFTGHGSGLNTALGTWHREGHRNRRNVSVVGAAFSSDGERLATLGQDGEVRLWSTSTGRELARPRAPDGERTEERCLGTGTAGVDLALASGTRVALLRGALEARARGGPGAPAWASPLPPDERGDEAFVRAAWVSPPAPERGHDGPGVTLRVALQEGYAMRVVELGPGAASPRRVLDVRLGRALFVAAAVSPDGGALAVGAPRVALWDLAAGRSRTLAAESHGALAWSPDGRHLAGRTLTEVVVWDLAARAAGPPSARLPVPGAWSGVDLLAFDARGELLVGVGSRRVFVWDLATGRLLADHPSHGTSVHALAASPCGRWFATGAKDQTARLWRLPGR